MFQSNSEEEDSLRRARYLMSPYNVKEARRARDFRNTVIGMGFSLAVLAGIALVMRYCGVS